MREAPGTAPSSKKTELWTRRRLTDMIDLDGPEAKSGLAMSVMVAAVAAHEAGAAEQGAPCIVTL